MFLQDIPSQLAPYPAVIFGSGPAGYATAMRLAEKRIPSLVIEAGAHNENAQLQNALADHEGHGHFDGRHWRSHSRIGLGGTSSVWTGNCMSLDRRDFSDWPISYDDLQPHYRRAAKLLGRDPSIIDYRLPWLDGFECKPYSSEAPLRISSRAGALAASDLIHIATNKILKRLALKPGANRVSEFVLVDARSGGEKSFAVPGNAKIVLALGGIGNPQMLLQPGEDGSPSLSARKGAAGKFLMEHPFFYSGRNLAVLDQSARFPKLRRKFGKANLEFLNSDRLWERAGRIACMLEFQEFPRAPDRLAGSLGQRLTAPKYYAIVVRFGMKPSKHNHIRLAGKNPYGIHSAVMHCIFGARDLACPDQTLQALARELGGKGLGFVRIDNESIYRKSYGQGHIMGATRMGGNPSDSVADRNARVHEVENLYLAGCSLFPGSGCATPTLTIAALAYRLADHLRERIGH